MTGYSLHIGLNYVDPNAYDGWDGELSGCINDANSMRQLAAAEGFRPTQLIDAQATSQAVIGEIALLAQQAVAGDMCVISYSGHGGQVDDFNGDEVDRKDETWVLYDRQVVDDELYQMWSQFAAGVRLLVLSDSCHSGTVARQMMCEHSRAGMRNHLGDSRDANNEITVMGTTPRNLPFGVQAVDNEKRRGTYQFVQALSGAKSDANIRAQLIQISGSQDNQLSYDGPVNGQFTGTLLRVWANGSFQGDYRAFHRAILDHMPPDQTPNLYTVGTVSPEYMSQRPFTVTPSLPSPTPVPTPGVRPTLRQGSTGSDVVYLQQRLNAHGANLTADGDFGPMTTQAVVAFQGRHNLAADGVVGPATWNALDTAPIGGGVGTGGSTPVGGSVPTGGGATPGNGASGGGGTGGGTATGGGVAGGGVSVSTRPTLRRGATGEHVTYLQSRLADLGYFVSVDGVFGPGTESTVRSFQRSNSLTADGVVGPQTWAALG